MEKLTTNQKAIKRLHMIDIPSMEDNGTVYVSVMDTYLELSEDEIKYQAKCWDEDFAEGELDDE